MADRAITELAQVTEITETDSFVLQQGSTAKRLTGAVLRAWLLAECQSHGGITSIEKTGTSGLVDTYTITYVDETTDTFTVTNGEKGDKGDKGDAPNVTGTTVLYGVSASASAQPSSFGTTIPTVTPGQFLWTKTTITFNNNQEVTFYSVTRYGIDGTGTVNLVDGKMPDANGNVDLTYMKCLVVSDSDVYDLPCVINNAAITANMVCLKMELSNPAVQTTDWTVTTTAGSVTIDGNQTLDNVTNITLYLIEKQ